MSHDLEKKLSPVLENYLEIIFHEENIEGAARTGTIAEKANVAMSTVTSSLKTLNKLGYINYSPYSLIRLTRKGKILAAKIAHRHMVLKDFFIDVLQIKEDKANSTACEIEHLLDEKTFLRFRQFMLYMSFTEDKWKNWQEELVEMKKLKKENKKNNEENIENT